MTDLNDSKSIPAEAPADSSKAGSAGAFAADGLAELMSDAAAAAWLGIARATLWRRVGDGTLPAPIRLGGRTLWRRSELAAALDRLAAERDAARAAAAAKGRRARP